MSTKILIAGVGNIFLGDDGFGPEVARSLSRRQLPENVSVKDFGIRGFDLAYTLLDPWDAVIIVDALPRGEAAGTLYVVEPDLAGSAESAHAAINPHGMDPVRVLNLAASLGTISAQVLIVGCEPQDFGDELEGRMGLSSASTSCCGRGVRHDCRTGRPHRFNEKHEFAVTTSGEVTYECKTNFWRTRFGFNRSGGHDRSGPATLLEDASDVALQGEVCTNSRSRSA